MPLPVGGEEGPLTSLKGRLVANLRSRLPVPTGHHSHPAQDRNVKTLPEMKHLRSVSLGAALGPRALWSAGSVKLSDRMNSVPTSLPVGEPQTSA